MSASCCALPPDGCPDPRLAAVSSVSLSPSESDSPLCAGCRLRIVDNFVLHIVDRSCKWHAACLRCKECGAQLESQTKCFEKDGLILCKKDYIRLHPPRCQRCQLEVRPTDLGIRARDCIFHVECFRCATCNVELRKPELFGMCDEALYCRLHFEQLNNGGGGANQLLPHPEPPFGHVPHGPHGPHFFPHVPFDPHLPHPHHPLHPSDPWFPPGEYPLGAVGGDYPYDNNNEPMLKKRRGRKKRKVVDGFPPMSGYMEGGFGCGLDASQAKTKRARTSFKHHQLRIMKAHFQNNQNPDSRELKLLSQKTGLDKKVLQVWFQNARAKWRRVNTHGGGSVGIEGASDHVLLAGGGEANAGSVSEENADDSDSLNA